MYLAGNFIKRIVLFTLLLSPFGVVAQHIPKYKCSATIVVDVDYKGSIYLLDKPGGKVIQTLRHDIANEDFLLLNIKDKNDSMFYVTAYYAISGYAYNGWIRKDAHALIIYTRDYDRYVKLYATPEKTPQFVEVKDRHDQNYYVADCHGDWLYVRLELKGKMYEGWLPPNMQCANPYTTCN